MRALRKALGDPEIDPSDDAPVTPPGWGPRVQPCVYPNWDNSPRSGRGGLVLTGATPERFQRNVEAAVASIRDGPEQERILWVKSWNEWAEGNHLEPDLMYGRVWLEALPLSQWEPRTALGARSGSR